MNNPKPQNADTVLQADASALARVREGTSLSAPPARDTKAVHESPGTSPPIDDSGEAIRRLGGRHDQYQENLQAGSADTLRRPAGEQGAQADDNSLSPPTPVDASVAPPTVDSSVGLALSGGGIRSATFGLGVLQRLAMLEHLERIDVLSTVSGGGYIGAWLSAWIYKTGFGNVAQKLKQCPESRDVEPPEVQWLRRYSNYLTPRVGALSLDALTVAATYLRNVLLNITILTACVSMLVLVPILLIRPTCELLNNPFLAGGLAVVLGAVALLATVVQLSPMAMMRRRSWARSAVVYSTVVGPGLLSAYFASPWLAAIAQSDYWLVACAMTTGAVVVLLVLGGAALALFDRIARKESKNSGPSENDSDAMKGPSVSQYTHIEYVPATLLSVPVGFAMLYGLAQLWKKSAPDHAMQNATVMLMVGPPLLVGAVALTVTLWIGLMGRAYPEMYREWWSRVGGASIAICAGWIAWGALAIVIPAHLKGWLIEAGTWAQSALAAGWLAALGTVIGLVRSFSGSATATKALPPLAKVAAALATIVLIALAISVACSTHALLAWIDANPLGKTFFDNVDAWTWSYTRNGQTQAITWLHPLPPAWLLFFISSVVAVILGWRVDINRFSLHDMYKNRLIRCYLGASHAERAPNLFTGFDPADDIALADLAPFEPAAVAGQPLHARPQRPFHVFNTALNLVHGSELSWQERKAALFVLTPTFCGFNLSPASGDKPLFAATPESEADSAREQAFRPTALYADNATKRQQALYQTHEKSCLPTNLTNGDRAGFTLGMAMATSGAAVSPNMGANSQPALAMLMTIFNIRLGRWCPNPAKDDWRRASPRSNLAWLVAEATGNTNERSAFVYLSDGGHFENTAVYELVRRRCSHIIMVDGGADRDRTFEDLGNLIRKCRVDMGAEIDLKLDTLYALANGRSHAGFITGAVTYAAGPGRSTGKILLIKPTLCDALAEPADIYNYAHVDSTFPQQTTLDQWFDESQFESYRFLGSSLTQAAFAANKTFFT